MSDFVYPSKYVTVAGESVALKPLMSRQEMELAEIFGDLIDEVPEAMAFLTQVMTSNGRPDYSSIGAVLKAALKHAPEHLTKAVMIVLDKDEDWVLSNTSIAKDYPRILYNVWMDLSTGASAAFDELELVYSDASEDEGSNVN